jgi:hypothetical protein
LGPSAGWEGTYQHSEEKKQGKVSALLNGQA